MLHEPEILRRKYLPLFASPQKVAKKGALSQRG
jgi:hypothetical protein